MKTVLKAKIRARVTKEIVKAKIYIAHPMFTKEQALRRGKTQDYITHIVATVGTRVVFEFRLSEFVSKNPIFKFKFKQKEVKRGDKLKITWQTLLGKSDSYSKKIR